MASSQEMDLILLIGNTLMVNKRFIAGVNAMWFYDYFLTLSDEIECVWSGRISPILMLFTLNRYWPMLYLIWMTHFGVPNTQKQCDKTSWLHVFYFTLATLFAQVAITLRVYAVTGNNRWIRISLSFITLVQFSFGMYLAVRFSLQPSLEFPDIPFDEFSLCTFTRWRPGELVNTVLSLAYDTLAFSIIVFSVNWRYNGPDLGAPSLMERIVQDSTLYFLVIFTSHLLLVLFELFAPQPIQLLPANANAVLVPLMVTRLMLSLRKVANSPGSVWSFRDTAQPDSLRFANQTLGGTGLMGGGTRLEHFPSEGKSSPPEP